MNRPAPAAHRWKSLHREDATRRRRGRPRDSGDALLLSRHFAIRHADGGVSILCGGSSRCEPAARCMYWDDADPYNYLRWVGSGDSSLLLIGGTDHKTGHGEPAESLRKLEDYAARAVRRASDQAALVGRILRAGRRRAVHRPRADLRKHLPRRRVLGHGHNLRHGGRVVVGRTGARDRIAVGRGLLARRTSSRWRRLPA